jgi:exodeoxyribonuclease VII large subunit
LRRHIDLQRGNLRASLDRVVTRKHRALNIAQMRFAALDLRARVAGFRRKWERDANDMQVRFDRVLVAKRRKLESAMMQLEERSPFRILERGYSIAYDASGKVLRSTDQVALGDDISLRLARGELAATVTKKSKDQN